MAVLGNLARMSTATTGAGTLTLASAAPGFLSFGEAGITNGQIVSYAIEDGDNREVGRGLYSSSGPTLTRSVLKSTNGNAAINLSGNAQVFITALAEDVALVPVTITSNTSAVADHAYYADTTAGAFTLTLPATAAEGVRVGVSCGSSVEINALTIDPNSQTFDGATSSFPIGVACALVFRKTSSQWRLEP